MLPRRRRRLEEQLDLERTIIRAPVAGIVTNRQVEVGQRIAAGAPIMVIVPIATAYVDANYKEASSARSASASRSSSPPTIMAAMSSITAR